MLLGDARENADDLEFSLLLTTRRPLPNKCSAERAALADRVVAMRDEQRIPFPAISAVLTAKGEAGASDASGGKYVTLKKVGDTTLM